MRWRILSIATCGLMLLMGLVDCESAFAQSGDVSQPPIPTLSIRADQVTAKLSSTLYGLMTEEINYSFEGGIYGELLRNRSFKADPAQPQFWRPIGPAALTVDSTNPLNKALNVSLKLDASGAAVDRPAGISNSGYWGIPVTDKTDYRVSFYAKAANGFLGHMRAELMSTDGATVFGAVDSPSLTGEWEKYNLILSTHKSAVSKDNHFTLTTTSPGTVWLQQVSLFPPTYHNRPNGNRPDLMQILGDLKPRFLRFPGGNYLEGDAIDQRFDWKKTIGDVAQRPGHKSPWVTGRTTDWAS